MSEKNQKLESEDYYPIRWKLADFAEDLFVLHRTALVAILALVGLGLILIGFLVLGEGQQTVETTTALERTASTANAVDDDAPEIDASNDGASADSEIDASNDGASSDDPSSNDAAATESTSAAPTTTRAPTITTTVAPTPTTSTTTTEAPVSERAPTSDDQLAATPSGAIFELTPTAIRLVGGLPDDSSADENVEIAELFFPGIEIDDQQVVDESFETPDELSVTMRLSAADLFGYNSDDINPTYLPLIDQIAAAVQESDAITVEISGHTDASGPADGNQRLSERRANSAAQRLTGQGVQTTQVTAIGRGEDQPIAPNDTEAGKLANRRVEFTITNL